MLEVESVKCPTREAFFPAQRVGKHWAIVSADSYRCWTARRDTAGKFIDITYRELVSDPMEVVRRIY